MVSEGPLRRHQRSAGALYIGALQAHLRVIHCPGRVQPRPPCGILAPGGCLVGGNDGLSADSQGP